jgi:hypothetical protein
MGLFARASFLASPGKSAGGLLRRSLAALESAVGSRAASRVSPRTNKKASAAPGPAVQVEAPQPRPSHAAPRVRVIASAPAAISAEELTYRVAAIPAGFAAPLQLFALLREVLGLQQAALVTYDPRRHVYAPLASIGLDATSRHRLRLEPGANADFNRAAAGNIVEVSGEELAAFRQYMSSRQFASVRQLALIPYLHNQRLVGMLLVARQARPGGKATLELLRSSMAAGGPLLAQDERGGEPAEDARTPDERLQATLAECQSRSQPLVLIRISLEELLRLAQERFPELESFRLFEFLAGACRRLLRGLGLVEVPRPPVLVLLVHGMKEADPPLLLRQLESALLAEIRGLLDARSVDLRPEVLTVTDDAQNARDFLRS